jgi:hypothetical protein
MAGEKLRWTYQIKSGFSSIILSEIIIGIGVRFPTGHTALYGQPVNLRAS